MQMTPPLVLMEKALIKLLRNMSKICEWFDHNGFKADAEKFNFFATLIRRQTTKNNWICYKRKYRGGIISRKN